MTRFPHDQFAKDFLESLLSPLGQVQTSLKISGEVREVDVYFIPNPKLTPIQELGILAECAKTAVIFEPYRNSVKVPQIRACMSKLYDLHSYLLREAKRQSQSELGDDVLPNLWILTPTLSAPILEGLGAKLELSKWGEGVYLLSPTLKTGIIVIHQLPKTPSTLWVRLLGKARVQAQAIQEVAALPAEHPYRNNALDLLGNLKVILEARETIEPEEQELIMQLSPLYLEKLEEAKQIGAQLGEQRGEQRGEIKGQQNIVIRLLKRRVGDISAEVLARLTILSLEQLEDLLDAALDFTQVNDLIAWLELNE
jgi:Domain of unknown function (DUF4351)